MRGHLVQPATAACLLLHKSCVTGAVHCLLCDRYRILIFDWDLALSVLQHDQSLKLHRNLLLFFYLS